MTCRFCGTALPVDALFCGECGRTVVAPTAKRRVLPEIMFSAKPEKGSAKEPTPRAVAVADGEYSCPQCAAPIDEDDVFCGDCGFVLTSSYLSAPSDALGDSRATAVVDSFVPMAAEPGAGPDSESDGEPESESESESEPEAAAEAEPLPFLEPELPTSEPEAVETGATPKYVRTAPDPFPWGQSPRSAPVDLEATRAVAGPHAEERFVLQFSTGESVTVQGAGLVGRNPASQPGEFVDHLVTVFDAGKSVSKTHLEFGQESGRFWVSDRFSTNGSIVRQPDADPKRCEPGRRYFVARGTRVDIGEQFFVIS